MKRIFIITIMLAVAVLTAASCEEGPVGQSSEVSEITVSLTAGGQPFPDNATVTLTSQNHSISYEGISRGGFVRFNVPAGLYDVSAFYRGTGANSSNVYNGSASIIVSSGAENSFTVDLIASVAGSLVIKELYVGGCQNDDGSGDYQHDKYVILYNNSDTDFDASNVCFAFAAPENSEGTNRYLVNGVLSFAAEGWIPAMYAVWWFETDVVIPPYSQIVVAIYGAIDHTITYSNSVDLSKAEYYAMYDMEVYPGNGSNYQAPSANIPSSHYLTAYSYGNGNSWPISKSGPAFFIFEKSDVRDFLTETSNLDYTYNNTRCAKVPEEWILDAVEVFRTDSENNNKRFTSTIDAGNILFRNQLGYSVYRNVDQEATEALEENEGLLVYNYSGGTDGTETSGSTDPSGIDAEASIANGAHIIYMDTNNSTNDFHMRATASLRK